jgi:UDP-2,3-diacylglucosamine pyrophosphatase LpxH
MNAIRQILVFSDLHMAPPGPLNNFHAGPQLAACLRKECTSDTLLVLNGDIFDFLQMEKHPRRLVAVDLPSLIQDMLTQVANTPWGRDVFAALGAHVAAGGRCMYLPGNHDPEMAHPSAEGALRRALGLAEDDPRLSIHGDSEPLSVTVGPWRVLIGHGHRGDAWNNIDTGQVRRAAMEKEPFPALPPGSFLVLDTLNTLKSKPDRRTGATYSFIDLLKPEGLVKVAILLWAGPRAAIHHLPGVTGNGVQKLVRSLDHLLEGGQHLGPDSSGHQRQLPNLLDELAEGLVATLTESERQGNSELLLLELEDYFEGRTSAANAGMLAGGQRIQDWFGRYVHKHTRRFFDLAHQDDVDRNIIWENLPEGSGPRIVICGHTHAARVCSLPGDRLYLNTGTWTDLMHFHEIFKFEDFMEAREKFLRNEVPRVQRLSYAKVTAEGGTLAWHEPDPVGS